MLNDIRSDARALMRPNLSLKTITFLIVLLAISGCQRTDDAQEIAKIKAKQSHSQGISEPQTTYTAAEQMFKDGKYSQASKALNKLLIAEPNHHQAKLLAARCMAENNEYAAALQIIEGIDQASSCFAESRDFGSRWANITNDTESEEAFLLELASRTPPLKRAIHRLGEIYSQQGRRREAGAMIKALAELQDVTESELFSILTLSNPVFGTTVLRCDAERKLDCLQHARKLRYDADLGSADAILDELTQKYPASTAVAAFRGRVISELSDIPRLHAWHQKLPNGIEVEPEYWIALGNWMQLLHQPKQSIRCFLEAILRDPTDYHSYRQLNTLLASLGNHTFDEALRQRQDYLLATVDIASKVGGRPGTKAELEQLCQNLLVLRRPFEALAWCQVATKQATFSPELSEHKLAAETMIRQPPNEHEMSQFICCGLNTKDWPLPELSTSPPPNVSPNFIPSSSEGTLPPIVFEEISKSRDIQFQYDNSDHTHGKSVYLHQLTGNGLAVIDYDLDGWPDIYCTQGGGDAFKENNLPNDLFRNLGQRFMNVRVHTGTGDRHYGQGVAVADLNQDGFMDLVVANVGPNIAYMNYGDGTFSKQTLPSSSSNGKWTTSAACGDINGDHLPDIYQVNYVDDPTAYQEPCTSGKVERLLDLCSPGRFVADKDELVEVQKTGDFALSTLNQTLSTQSRYGFAATIANFDDRHGNDIYVANDVGANLLWLSHQDAESDRFALREVADVMGCSFGLLGQRQGSMGLTSADFDGNGLIDFYVANYWNQAADLYMLQPSLTFQNESAMRGTYDSTRLTVGWGAQSIDLDNDSWHDIVTLNGHVVDHRSKNERYQQTPQVHRNLKGQFIECSPPQLLGDFWTTPTLGRTLATLDLDLDGDLDLLASHLDAPLSLLENRTQTNHHYLQMELVGTESERDAIGAKITIHTSEGMKRHWVTGGDGFLCSNDPVVQIGLGNLTNIDGVTVVWPSGNQQKYEAPALDNRYLIIEGHTDLYKR